MEHTIPDMETFNLALREDECHGWWCQTNSNQSLQGQRSCPLCRAELTPLGESSGSVQLEIGSGVEAAFLVEMI